MTSTVFNQVQPKRLSPLGQYVLFSPLELLIHERLGQGVHAFSSKDEIFTRLGVENVTDGSLYCWNGTLATIPTKPGIVYKMSYLQFGRLVHRMKTVRLRRHSLNAVKYEGFSRYEIIVS